MRTWDKGFTIVEMLVALLIASVVLGAGLSALYTQGHVHVQQNMTVAMEQNLRIGMAVVTDNLRVAGYGEPATMAQWIPWVSLTQNPAIGTNEVSVVRCTPLAVLSLSGEATLGTTAIAVQSEVPDEGVGSTVDVAAKRLLFIAGGEHVHVVGASGGNLTIDTDPAPGDQQQGLSRAYPLGTTMCRVDVLTFKVETNSTTGVSELLLDENQGEGATVLAEGISELKVVEVDAGSRYTVTLTAQTNGSDPLTGNITTRSLLSDVALRNAL